MHTKKFIEKFFKTYKANEIDSIVVTNFDEAEFVCVLQIVTKLLQIDQSELESMLGLKKKSLSDIFNMYDKNCKRKRNVSYEIRFCIYQKLLYALNILWMNIKENITKYDVNVIYNLKHVENVKRDLKKIERVEINRWTKDAKLKINTNKV